MFSLSPYIETGRSSATTPPRICIKLAIESLVIDGQYEPGEMAACDFGEGGFTCPYALFSPDLQQNVGGPYASREHAAAALQMMLEGRMIPYTSFTLIWSVNGKPSPWYEV